MHPPPKQKNKDLLIFIFSQSSRRQIKEIHKSGGRTLYSHILFCSLPEVKKG